MERSLLYLQVQEKTYACDLKTYALSPSTQTLGRAASLPLEMPMASHNGGGDSGLEVAVVEWVILDLDCEPLVVRIE